MRAVELLGAAVYDNSGRHVGNVRDLRFEAAGQAPADVAGDSGQPAFRLTELECGSAGLGHRLGFGNRDMAGPWPLDRILTRLDRRALIVHWDQIGAIDGGRIELAVPADDLRHLGDEGQ
jgi:hypothetical protein